MTAISGSTVLLTGASGGLGQAIARALAARGARLVLTARRAEVLEALAADVGGRVLAVDLTDRDALQRLAVEAGEVDILVANAGIPAMGTLPELSIEDLDRHLDVNLRAPIVLAKLLAPAMAARGRGHVVFVSSLAGKSASPRSSMYTATKAGLRGFALSLREDLRPAGVGVSTIFPGFIRDAGMFAEAGVTLPAGIGTRTPEDVAAAVVRAIERDRAEVDVAPLSLRIGAALAGVFPQTAAAVSRRSARRITTDLEAGHRAAGRG